MFEILMQERQKLIDKMEEHRENWRYASRDNYVKLIESFDKDVLWKYIDSKEVNSKLLEELQFYTK